MDSLGELTGSFLWLVTMVFFLVLLLSPRLLGLAAQLGIWISARLAGQDEVYGEDRADGGRMARHGRARTALAPRGKVFVSGEIWHAEATEGAPVAAGERVEVVSRDGMLLRVRAARDEGTA